MPFRFLILLGACALVPALAQTGAPLAIELHSGALIDHPRIALADVALIRAGQTTVQGLEQLELGPAPRVGYVERITRAQLEQAIHRHAGFGAIEWSGAASVAVRVQAQTVKAEQLAAAAVAAVRHEFGNSQARLEVTVTAPPADLDVPTGPLELRARRVGPANLAPRMPLWIDLVVNGAVYRSAVVQLAIAARQPAYVALHPMAPGAWAGQDDFAIAESNVAGIAAVPVGAPLAPFRLREPLKAGQLLAGSAVGAGNRVLRGDQVKLVITSGQIGIETSGVAMAEAGPGQLLAVRPLGGSNIVTGRLSQSGTVNIE
jgi:flagella basal body P-ring formation protein FlgA